MNHFLKTLGKELFLQTWDNFADKGGSKIDKKYFNVTNLFYLKTINLFTVYFVYNFYNFKYLKKKRQQSAVIICAIRTTRIKLINLFFFMMKNFKSQLKKPLL